MTRTLIFGACLLACLAATSATYCRQQHCSNHCPRGYETDRHGCQTCRCKDPCADLPACDKHCPDGFKKNGDGCDICMCDKPVCEQPKVVGPCEAAIPSWYYNRFTKQCKHFVFGGCQGNDNRFSSKAACERTCPIVPVCEQPKKVGPCKAAIPRWYFNKQTMQCQQFRFGGCQANGNNFASQADCENTCPVVPVCEQPKKVGPCDNNVARWYYDENTRLCKRFSFGGCQANSNNFETKADCEETCPVDYCYSLPPCHKDCPNGFKKNTYGCDICECKQPVTKPGTCPSVRGFAGICVTLCFNDQSCPGRKKCCSNGCGKVCRDPATTTAGCPRYSPSWPSSWRTHCTSDHQCQSFYKCCPAGHGNSKRCVPRFSVGTVHPQPSQSPHYRPTY